MASYQKTTAWRTLKDLTAEKPNQTEMQLFLAKHGRELTGENQALLSQYSTLSEAWLQCNNSVVMLCLLQVANCAGNFRTSLLTFTGNVINFTIGFLIHEATKRLLRETSCMIIMCVHGLSQKEFHQELTRLNGLVHKVLTKDNDYLHQVDRESCVVCQNILSVMEVPAAAASVAATWYFRSRMFAVAPPEAVFSDCKELRLLVGNPFEESL